MSSPAALHVDDLPVHTGTDYPAPHDEPCRQRRRRRLGDAFGLEQFGVNLLEPPPGSWSAQRHWHERQDEFIYVLEGEVTLVTDQGATLLTQGMTPEMFEADVRADLSARQLMAGVGASSFATNAQAAPTIGAFLDRVRTELQERNWSAER